jgi:hypothetical protein
MNYRRGFGFRGSSPDWPYIGRGRGGLPRCWAPGLMPGYGPPPYGDYPDWNQTPYTPQMTQEQELGFLREEANALKRQLEEIDARITEIEPGETKE